MTRTSTKLILLFLMWAFTQSCYNSTNKQKETTIDGQLNTVVKRRDDGTVSSVNQVDEFGLVHGLRVTYFSDGNTVYSKITFKHGKKQGPSVRYYDNGQIFKHNNFEDGKKHGLTRKYYKDGKLLASYEYKLGNALPGLKEYDKSGTLITSYPEVHFKEFNYLSSKNRIDLEVFSHNKKRGIKYYLIESEQGKRSRVYLISENSSASMQFYVKLGDTLNKDVEIVAEIPTELGNMMVQFHTYHLTAVNKP